MNVATNEDLALQRNLITSFIQIAALVILVAYCLIIIGPFASVVLWGILLAVAIYPLFLKLAAWLGGRQKTAATIVAIIGLAVLLIPGWVTVTSTVDTASRVMEEVHDGTLKIPPPRDSVKGWPIVGERLHKNWSEGSQNAQAFLQKHRERFKELAESALTRAFGLFTGLMGFAASIIIAAVFLVYAQPGYTLCCAIAERIAPGRGSQLTGLSIATVRSVTNGVLGVAFIQAVLAGIGFFLIGLPAPGIFTLVILVTAIIQIPAILIMVPVIIWVYSFADPVAATIFAVWSVLVALSDNLLKPLLLGRGVDLPVLVVLLGAIGGMIQFGIIGLFVGAVILGLGYRIITAWLWPESLSEAELEAAESAS